MLPSAGRFKRMITLSAPRQQSSNTGGKSPSASPAPRVPSLLSSVVFEPGIPCNAGGAWIQGAFAVLSQTKADLQVLTGILMARNPQLGFLWLGASLLDIHYFVLDGMRALFYPVDLTLAGWTYTLMSFIQEPVRNPSPVKEAITRADEARLLFLSQSTNYTQPPIVPFQPFGLTAVTDCNLEVQEQVRCRSTHGLYYSGWTWDYRDGSHIPIPQSPPVLLGGNVRKSWKQKGRELEVVVDNQITIDYSHIDRENDGSEAVTRSIFMWLRGADGFPIAEREIREHEWIDNLYESDDESASPEGDGRSMGNKKDTNIASWIARTATYRRNNFY
ncbi:hypothetical protein MFIFM68171_04642 [Madurella fahalii]|uniref:Uncharacterized protein n=1 Tax=Madurella fahalii TaxID=1157608 RepID=A0ABQ0G9K4_9PEZI